MATLRMVAPWQDPKSGIWHFRRRIPKEFREAAGGREMMKWSLETRDRKEAQRKWPSALERWEQQVAEWSRLSRVEELTPERAAELAAMWAARIAAGQPLALPVEGLADLLFEAVALGSSRPPEHAEALSLAIEAHAHEALHWAGISASAGSFPLLTAAMRAPVGGAYMEAGFQGPRYGGAIARALRPLSAVREGLPPVPPDLIIGAQAPAEGPTITSLYERWAAVAAVKPRTATEIKYHVEDLKRFVGHDIATRLTVEDMRNWRDDLIKRGLNNNTVNARFGAVRQVFLRAEADQVIASNPADAKLRLRKQTAAAKHPYTLDEARRILKACRAEVRPSRRWSHWIMAFTGMRVGEVLQLMGRDVQQDGGIWFLSVNADDPTATVKNGRKRHVPIHSALIAEGFLAFAQGVEPDAPLFPDKGLGKHGKRGERAWQVVGRWVREEVGITDKAKAPNHSWRHYFEDALRDAQVPSDDRDAIIGHAPKTMGRQYGVKGEALAKLARGIEKVPSPLSRE